MKDKKVKFIRRKGRVIPIKVSDRDFKGYEKTARQTGAFSTKNSGSINKKEYSQIFKDDADNMDRLAKTGDKIAVKGGIMTALLGAGAAISKKRRGKLGVGAAIFGLGTSIVMGQNSNLREGARTSREIASGKDPNKTSGIFGRSHRSRSKAKMLQKYIKNGSSV